MASTKMNPGSARAAARGGWVAWLAVGAAFVILLTACTTTEQLAMSELYSVNTKIYKDIRGDFSVDSLLLWKRITWSNEIVTLNRFVPDGKPEFYGLQVRYLGAGWRFMDTIHLRTDNGLHSLKDDSPSRDVFSGGEVQEVVSVLLPPEIVDELRLTSRLTLQFFTEPVEIPEAGVTAIRDFVSKNRE